MSYIKKYLNEIRVNPGRGFGTLAKYATHLIEDTRAELGVLLGISTPDNISFTYNATHALNIALQGSLSAGDHVIISNFEHNSVIRPLSHLKKTRHIEFDILSADTQGFFDLKGLESLINPKTKLIVFSHASNVLGVITPIKQIGELAKKHGILFCVDCAQTAGIVDIEAEKDGIDILAGTCHKGLLGPSGVGFLYVRDQKNVASLFQGGGGYNSASDLHPELGPHKYEAGTINYLGIAGLRGSLEEVVKNKKIYHEHEKELLADLLSRISEMPFIKLYGTQLLQYKVPLVSFNVHNFSAQEVCSYLEDSHGIITRGGLHCSPLIHKAMNTAAYGSVRISLGPYNTLKDIKAFIKALYAFATLNKL